MRKFIFNKFTPRLYTHTRILLSFFIATLLLLSLMIMPNVILQLGQLYPDILDEPAAQIVERLQIEQRLLSSISATSPEAADSDHDGIPDLTDTDDDNDGIADLMEMESCKSSSEVTMVTFLPADSLSEPASSSTSGVLPRDVTPSPRWQLAEVNNGVLTLASEIVSPSLAEAIERDHYIEIGFDLDENDGTSYLLTRLSIDFIDNVGPTRQSQTVTIVASRDGFRHPLGVVSRTDEFNQRQLGVSVRLDAPYLISRRETLRLYIHSIRTGGEPQLQMGNDSIGMSNIELSGKAFAKCDADADGVANHLDLDSDGDGMSDLLETIGLDRDADGLEDSMSNGITDTFDPDANGDGQADRAAAYFADPFRQPLDTDGDGIENYLDGDTRIVVNDRQDYPDEDGGQDTCLTERGTCTLRAAIQVANAVTTPLTIAFAMRGGGPHAIVPAAALPTITSDYLTIDASTQTDVSCGTGIDAKDRDMRVAMNGGKIQKLVKGLSPDEIDADLMGLDALRIEGTTGVTIKGLTIYGFPGSAIKIVDAKETRIMCNYIGTYVFGMSNFRNDEYGIVQRGADSEGTIVGTDGDGINDGGEWNLISGNGLDGIAIQEGKTGGRIAGNIIGLNVTGILELGNGRHGVLIEQAKGLVIGTNGDGVSDSIEGNLISANSHDGIRLQSQQLTGSELPDPLHLADDSVAYSDTNTAIQSDVAVESADSISTRGIENTSPVSSTVVDFIANTPAVDEIMPRAIVTVTIAGNHIGTNPGGLSTIGNIGNGVYVGHGVENVTIGAVETANLNLLNRNVIASNRQNGILVEDLALDIRIVGNHIGTNSSGSLPLGHHRGIHIRGQSDGVLVHRNLVSWSRESGVVISGAGVEVTDNDIQNSGGSGMFIEPHRGVALGRLLPYGNATNANVILLGNHIQNNCRQTGDTNCSGIRLQDQPANAKMREDYGQQILKQNQIGENHGFSALRQLWNGAVEVIAPDGTRLAWPEIRIVSRHCPVDSLAGNVVTSDAIAGTILHGGLSQDSAEWHSITQYVRDQAGQLFDCTPHALHLGSASVLYSFDGDATTDPLDSKFGFPGEGLLTTSNALGNKLAPVEATRYQVAQIDLEDTDLDGVLDVVEDDAGTNPIDPSDNDSIYELIGTIVAASDAPANGGPTIFELRSPRLGLRDVYAPNSLGYEEAIATASPTPLDTVQLQIVIDRVNEVLDADGDGLSNLVEGTANPDGDGLPNYLDSDSDNDGIGDYFEDLLTAYDSETTPADEDEDQVPDEIEIYGHQGNFDEDWDAIPSISEDTNGNGNPFDDDTDGDGIANYLDRDSDGDGILDALELNDDSSDNDGLPNYLDLDSDNDGVFDSYESINIDSDQDGTVNFLDSDSTPLDSDRDGIPDDYEGDSDFDRDGIANDHDVDSDNDGISDALEYMAHTNPYLTAQAPLDSDQDGIPDKLEDGAGAGLFATDYADQDQVPNRLDTDSDDDGIPDASEDTNGNGNPFDDDQDGNGWPDFLDASNSTDHRFTVDSAGDEIDARLGDGRCDVGNGSCTLRAAIEEANVLRRPLTIDFNIGGSQPVYIIKPKADLPILAANQVIIDGTTQPGASCGPQRNLRIAIHGADLPHGAIDHDPPALLRIRGSKITIRGIIIDEAPGYGLELIGAYTGGDNLTVQCNNFGTDGRGERVAAGGAEAIYLANQGSGHIIGVDGDGINDDSEYNVFFNAGDAPTVFVSDNHGGLTIAGNYFNTAVPLPTALEAAGEDASSYRTERSTMSAATLPVAHIWLEQCRAIRIGTDLNGVSDAIERNILDTDIFGGIRLENCEDVKIAGNQIRASELPERPFKVDDPGNQSGLDGWQASVPHSMSGGIEIVTSNNIIIGGEPDRVSDSAAQNVIVNQSENGIVIRGLDALCTSGETCARSAATYDIAVIGNRIGQINVDEARSSIEGYGVLVRGIASNITVADNQINNATLGGVAVVGAETQILSNTITNHGASGIQVAPLIGPPLRIEQDGESRQFASSDTASSVRIAGNVIQHNCRDQTVGTCAGVLGLDDDVDGGRDNGGLSLWTQNVITSNNESHAIAQYWYGAVEIIDPYGVLQPEEHVVELESSNDGPTYRFDAKAVVGNGERDALVLGTRVGGQSFKFEDILTWTPILEYAVDQDGNLLDYQPLRSSGGDFAFNGSDQGKEDVRSESWISFGITTTSPYTTIAPTSSVLRYQVLQSLAPPPPPTIALMLQSQALISSSTATTVSIGGRAPIADSQVRVMLADDISNTMTVTATVQPDRMWQTPVLDLTSFHDGEKNIAIKASTIDQRGQVSAPSVQLLSKDTVALPAEISSIQVAPRESGVDLRTIEQSNVPLFQGVGENGSTVELVIGGNTYTTTVSGSTWHIRSTLLSDGIYTASLQVRDAVGNKWGPEIIPEVVVDVTPPGNALFDPVVTNMVSPRLSGQLTFPSALEDTVVVRLNGLEYQAANDGNGSWDLAARTVDPLPHGQYTLTIEVEDTAGNKSTSHYADAVNVDLIGPEPVVVDKPAERSILGNNRPEFRGTGETGLLLTMLVNEQTFTTTVDSDGIWQITLPDPLRDGLHKALLSVSDRAGNTINEPQAINFSIDSRFPGAPRVDPVITRDTTPPLSGILSPPTHPDDRVTVYLNDQIYEATNTGDGRWVVPDNVVEPLLPGPNVITVRVTDSANNTSVTKALDSLVLDNLSPGPATMGTIITNDSSPSLHGLLTFPIDARDQITVTVNGMEYLATNSGTGTWHLDDNVVESLPEGPHSAQILVTDVAGNRSHVEIDNRIHITSAVPGHIQVSSTVTNLLSPAIRGTITPAVAAESPLTVTFNGAEYRAMAQDNGDWEIPAGHVPLLNEGLYTVTALFSGSTGIQALHQLPGAILIDQSPPKPPQMTAPRLGRSLGNPRPTIRGTSEEGLGAIVELRIDKSVYTAPVRPDGQWAITVQEPLSDGTHKPLLTLVDGAGNRSTTVSGVTFVIDTEPPGQATMQPLVVNDRRPALFGSLAEPSHSEDLVRVRIGQNEYDAINRGGSWVLPNNIVQTLAVGTYTVTLSVRDAARNITRLTIPEALTIDVTPPGAATIYDLATNRANFKLHGNLERPRAAEDQVFVLIDGRTYTATRAPKASWILTGSQIAMDLSDGDYATAVFVQDMAGNRSAQVVGQLMLDDTPPGEATMDKIVTSDTSPLLWGELLEPTDRHDQVFVMIAGATYTATNTGDGTWSIEDDRVELASDQQYTVTLTVSDPFSNISRSTFESSVVVDTKPPDAPMMTSPVAGASLAETRPLIKGTAPGEEGALVQVALANQTLTSTVGSSGEWHVTVPISLARGIYSPTITIFDMAGNVTGPISGNSFYVDGYVPSQVTMTSPLADSVLNNRSPIVAGRVPGEPGAQLSLTLNDQVYRTTVAGDETWEISLTDALPAGIHTPTFVITDVAGNVSSMLTGNQFEIDLSAPDPPHLVSDGQPMLIYTNTLLMKGTAEPGSTVSVGVHDLAICSAPVSVNRQWSCLTPELPGGVVELKMTAVDVAGNESEPVSQIIIVDGGTDSDADGLSDEQEAVLLFNPTSADSDSDATTSDEANNSIIDANEDLDGDGLVNWIEFQWDTDPLNQNDPVPEGHVDSDGDGLTDAQEYIIETDAAVADSESFRTGAGEALNGRIDSQEDLDDDGLSNAIEFRIGSDPLDINSPAVAGDTDVDGDGLSNGQEWYLKTDSQAANSDSLITGAVDEGQNQLLDSLEDLDGDGLNNRSEFAAGSDPLDDSLAVAGESQDGDGDGLTDRWEELLMTDPSLPDSDSAATSDVNESGNFITDDAEDFDGDGLSNLMEITLGSDPLSADDPSPNGQDDEDADRLSNAQEHYVGMDSMSPDADSSYTDGINEASNGRLDGDEDLDQDGLSNRLELNRGWDPLSINSPVVGGNLDSDGDGLTNAQESYLGTGPKLADSGSRLTLQPNLAGNGILDGAEDLDGDGLSNALEFAISSDPLNTDEPVASGSQDSDNDGMTDAQESYLGTNPSAVDSNSLRTPWVNESGNGLNDLMEDLDQDGLSNETEWIQATDPLNPGDPAGIDSDGDLVENAMECPSGMPCPDSNQDGLPDYLDPDVYPSSEFAGTATAEGRSKLKDAQDKPSSDSAVDDSEQEERSPFETGLEDNTTERKISSDEQAETGTPTSTNEFLFDSLLDGTTEDAASSLLGTESTDYATESARANEQPRQILEANEYQDSDSDGDGIKDSVEGDGDLDGDGIPNHLDSDSDGDGELDAIEGVEDANKNGLPDYLDAEDPE